MSGYEQQELIESMPLSEVSPVSPTRLQGIEEVVKTIARYTPTTSDCFASFNQDGRCLKTSSGYSQLTLDGSPETYSEPLPKNGMMRGGKLYRVPSLGELIKESDCSLRQSDKNLLPTPTHSDRNTAGVKSHKKGQQKHLSVAVRKLLPTPKHTDFKRLRDRSDNRMRSLPGAVNKMASNKTKLLLNPKFTERMMGFPSGWTDTSISSDRLPEANLLQLSQLEDFLPLALCEKKLNHRIRLGQIGNAIVPQVAAVMFDLVAELLPRCNENKEFERSAIAQRTQKVQRTSVEYAPAGDAFPLDKNSLIDEDAIDKLFPKIDKSDERLQAGKIKPLSKRQNGYLQTRQIKREGKVYTEHYYRYYESGKQRSRYVKRILVSKVREAISTGNSIQQILFLLRGDERGKAEKLCVKAIEEVPHSQSILNRASGENTTPLSKKQRKLGEGTGYIISKPIEQNNKIYKQYWFCYEIWNGGKCQKKSKYIPKRKLSEINQLNIDKMPVSKILEALGKQKND